MIKKENIFQKVFGDSILSESVKETIENTDSSEILTITETETEIVDIKEKIEIDHKKRLFKETKKGKQNST